MSDGGVQDAPSKDNLFVAYSYRAEPPAKGDPSHTHIHIYIYIHRQREEREREREKEIDGYIHG